MIELKRISVWERVKRALSPAYRRRRDAELAAAIRFLVDNPGAPCAIEGRVIPDGYGSGRWP